MEKLRFEIQKNEVEQVRTYHVRFLIPKSSVQKIEAIDGVERVENDKKYQVAVWIGKAFSWDEIEPKVLAILLTEEPIPCPEERP